MRVINCHLASDEGRTLSVVEYVAPPGKFTEMTTHRRQNRTLGQYQPKPKEYLPGFMNDGFWSAGSEYAER